ncbi:MAG: hypothetical protein HY458_00740 [Parcubacteria group bacterium]|nr:hypothetical protein [Parcubacteria group bacterium]
MEIIDDIVKKIRDGLFLAPSRSYGEQYVEPFVREKYNLNEPKGNDHDATDQDGKRYEIKACKVLKASGNVKKLKTIIERILFENNNLETNRLVPFSECKTAEYLANVQNVKRDHFDYLIYVLLFGDCVKIFLARREDISTGKFSNWSDRHGRYDEVGKSGQFGITKSNIQWHLDNNLKDTVTYQEMTDIYKELSEQHVSKKHNNTKPI